MALLAVLQRDPSALARLHAALRDDHRFVEVPDWEALLAAVDGEPVDGCIVDPYGPDERLGFRHLIRLRRRQPPVAIVVHAHFAGRELDLFELGRHKIDGVLLCGSEDSRWRIRRTVDRALGAAVATRVTRGLVGRVRPLEVEALRWAIEHAHREPDVGALAEALSCSPRVLARRCRERSIPSPRRLLIWGRLFRSAHLLHAGDRTVEQAAYRVGYASGSGLSRAFRRETGCPPSEVLARGGVAWVMQAFQRSRGDATDPAAGEAGGGTRERLRLRSVG